LNYDELCDLVALGHELRVVEFKGPGHFTEQPLLARTIRAILGMANIASPGRVIVGVSNEEPHLVGLSSDQLSGWNFDNLADQLSKYAEPSVQFDLSRVPGVNGRHFVVIAVQPFNLAPVICKRDYTYGSSTILRRGALYIRPRGKPETTEIASFEDMQELLQYAIDQGVRRELDRLRSLGLVGSYPVSVGTPAGHALYASERSEFLDRGSK
jgi:predicted HTH transcriptional regulator